MNTEQLGGVHEARPLTVSGAVEEWTAARETAGLEAPPTRGAWSRGELAKLVGSRLVAVLAGPDPIGIRASELARTFCRGAE